MAVGLHRNETKRVINLTQLRKNKRKKADKTSGRKRPRTDDVDVIAAPDADDNADLVDILHPSQADVEPDDEQQQQSQSEQDICHKCLADVPPGRQCKNINWVECDVCNKWFHNICVGIKIKKPRTFICESCEH